MTCKYCTGTSTAAIYRNESVSLQIVLSLFCTGNGMCTVRAPNYRSGTFSHDSASHERKGNGKSELPTKKRLLTVMSKQNEPRTEEGRTSDMPHHRLLLRFYILLLIDGFANLVICCRMTTSSSDLRIPDFQILICCCCCCCRTITEINKKSHNGGILAAAPPYLKMTLCTKKMHWDVQHTCTDDLYPVVSTLVANVGRRGLRHGQVRRF
jgi:hypothetical protein